MLPQNCSRIHYPISINLFLQKKQMNISNYTLSICCFDYLINLDEFFSDNLMQNYFYYQFIKIVYNLDKKNILDFQNYNKDSLLKFIIIANKICCYYYIREKIKYSKFLSNLIVSIIQNYFKKNNNIINNKQYKKNNNFIHDLKNNNLISTIYNNACCNYFKTSSFNKCSKFLEYSNKNIEENDINNKLIYYNNALIITTRNKLYYNINNIDNDIKIINKLILLKRKYFDNIYLNNIHYNNGGNNHSNNILKNNLKKNEENYNSFKLLSFIMYNYGFAMEYLLNQKKQAKKYYKNSYDYICKYLGKNSFEAQKFLFKINYKKNINNFFESMNYNINDEDEIIDNNKKKRNFTPINIRGKNNKKNKKNNNIYDEDIDLKLKSIMKKIENFEQILQNNEVLNNIIQNEKNNNNNNFNQNQNQSQYEYKNNNINNSYNIQNENKIINNKKEINNISYDNNKFENNNINKKNEINNNIIKKEIKTNIEETKNKNNKSTEKKEENKNNNTENNEKKKTNIKEKITFDMMDNIIEEFKKESQEKIEQQKKLKEEKEKERKLKEENEKKEKEKNGKEKPSENKDIKIKIEKTEENKNDLPPKKPLRIKKLFQKVLGMQEKEPPKTKLGELFQSLMKSPQEEKKKGPDEGGKEIKIENEANNNFINLDDDEEDIKDKNDNEQKEENNYSKINNYNINNKSKSGFGYKINVNLDKSDYSYNATTLYQENNTSE